MNKQELQEQVVVVVVVVKIHKLNKLVSFSILNLFILGKKDERLFILVILIATDNTTLLSTALSR